MSNYRFLVIGVLLCISKVKGTLADSCTVSQYSDVATAAKNCDTLTIQDLVIPSETTLNIDLKAGATLIFDGKITHKIAEWTGDLIQVTGSNVEIYGTANHLLDGQGAKHWKGSDEPTILRPKMIRFTIEGSKIRDLKLKNCPCNCFMVTKSSNVVVSNINIDNYDGYPGVAGEKFAKNTVGFDVSGTSNLRVENSVVVNQDDCVAVNSGSNMVFDNLHCNGSHGLSIPARNGDVSNIKFLNSKVEYSNNVVHVKAHNDGDFSGSISNILYKNIEFVGIDRYAVSVQENYPSGEATANIPITDFTLDNIKGSMTGSKSMAFQIICAKGGCSDWTFKDVEVTGAQQKNTCEEVPNGITC